MAPDLKIAVFAYNFPHKKTQDFLLRMIIDGLVPRIVLAADRIELDIPQPSLRVKPRHIDLLHPSDLCKRFHIEYKAIDHNSEECCNHLRDYQIEIGVLAGARILGQHVLRSVVKGIINIHPGLLPESRGLDALQWAIYERRPIGVTSHVINSRIDHGHIIRKVIIAEYPDDSLIDLSLRLEQTQTNILTESIDILRYTNVQDLEPVAEGYSLHKKMPVELEAMLPKLLEERFSRLLLRR